MNLTQEELAFLKKHNVTPEDVFDSRGMSGSDRDSQMKKEGKIFTIGSDCKKSGHRLRTRKNRCIQCNTSAIAYMKRSQELGYVYIAGSKSASLIKIGYTNNIPQREDALCYAESYAGINDWLILTFVKLEKAGAIENEIQTALYKYSAPRVYEKQGKEQEAKEVFSCSFFTALKEFETIVSNKSIFEKKEHNSEYCKKYYDFPNTEGDGYKPVGNRRVT